jgi:hypothetical protein
MLMNRWVHKAFLLRDARDQCVLGVVVGFVSQEVFFVHGLFKLGHVSIAFQLVVVSYLGLKDLAVGFLFQTALVSLLVVSEVDVLGDLLLLTPIDAVNPSLDALDLLLLRDLPQQRLSVLLHCHPVHVRGLFLLLTLKQLGLLVLHLLLLDLLLRLLLGGVDDVGGVPLVLDLLVLVKFGETVPILPLSFHLSLCVLLELFLGILLLLPLHQLVKLLDLVPLLDL